MEFEITKDMHTHTFRSDGHGSVEDNIKTAAKKGLLAVAITDHGPFHNKKSRCTFEEFLKTKQEIEELKTKYAIETFFGIETNLVSVRGDIDITKEQEKEFQWIVLGTHKTPHGKTFGDFFTWKLRNLFPEGARRREKVTNAYLKAMENHNINIVAHPNYCVTLNMRPIAKLAAQKGILIELNNKHVDEISPKQIDEVLEEGANFIISSDAHYSERVGNVDRVFEFLKQHSIPKERIVNLKVKGE